MDTSRFRKYKDGGGWDHVVSLPYKEDGDAPFHAISRRTLFADPGLACELRYFEIEAGGFSTLERHAHVHAVTILTGGGRCLVGHEVREVAPFDLVTIPAWDWHQFRAAADRPLGFLCMVNAQRDRPRLPSEDEMRSLLADPRIADFLTLH